MHTPRIAVIGTGIAGMASAWLLSRRCEVTVYEADSHVGGHSNTVMLDDPRGPSAVDTGFIVHNRLNYPQLSALFQRLGVATQPGEMSFAVSLDAGRLEYSGTGLNGLFGQRRNLLRPAFHRMLVDIVRFNRAGKRLAREGGDEAEPLGAFLDRHRLRDALRDQYLLPMAAAIWSCPPAAMLDFPALSLVRFYDNHGLLNLDERPQWRTVSGGSVQYVRAIMAPLADRLRLATPVTQVVAGNGTLRVLDARGGDACLDHVVIATHADQARRMLPDGDLRARLLGAFGYQDNHAVLHTDRALMPRRRRVWSAWNYLATGGQAQQRVSVTYWMNLLQRLRCEREYFVSLNPLREPQAGTVLARFDYSHPVFDAAAMAAQTRLPEVNGQGGVWLAGSYFGHGFHEDALCSAVDVATRLDAPPPWSGHDIPIPRARCLGRARHAARARCLGRARRAAHDAPRAQRARERVTSIASALPERVA